MYRVSKVLNHNAVIGITEDETKEVLLMAKGIGFGKKIAERIEIPKGTTSYSLEKTTSRGESRQLARNINPVCLEIANGVLETAKRKFENLDQGILFPLADHIEFAVRRMRNNEFLSNPLTEDIKLLFAEEYAIALTAVPMIKEQLGVEINEDEVGYIALHVHSAIDKEEISSAMKTTQGVKNCLTLLEEALGTKLDFGSISYNRLINHIRFMIIRGFKQEEIKLNINDYIRINYPDAYEVAQSVCDQLGDNLGIQFLEAEIGYFAMHLQRVLEK